MAGYLNRRLECFARLSADDRQALEAACRERVVSFRPQADVAREGERPRALRIFLEGWACRHKTLEDGRRQILSFLLPGDVCDMNVAILRQMDHSISALTSLTVAELDAGALDVLFSGHPQLARALWWSAMVDASVQREWTLSLGQRSALERTAHLFCELFCRLRLVGLVTDHAYELPLTQAALGDTLGLSAVHVNRVLQEMRALGLIELKGKHLRLLDFERLKAAALFNGTYLHMAGEDARHGGRG